MIAFSKTMHKQASLSKNTLFILPHAATCKDVPPKLCSIAALTQTTMANFNSYFINHNPGRKRIRQKTVDEREKRISEENKTVLRAGF